MRNVQIRALLFDYGGTLDGEDHWGARFARLYREAGVDAAPEVLRAAFERAEAAVHAEPNVHAASLRDVIELHVRTQLTTLALNRPALQRALADRFVTESEVALAHNHRVLATLAPQYALGVVSNFYGNVATILAAAGFSSLLSVIVDSSVVGCAKPDAQIFQHALRALGTEGAETMHVGDSYDRDVLAAHAAGLRTTWLAPPSATAVDCVADVRVHALDELPLRLSSLNSGRQP